MATNLAMRDMFETHLKDEYRRRACHHAARPCRTGHPDGDTLVRTPADLAGKKMRIPDRRARDRRGSAPLPVDHAGAGSAPGSLDRRGRGALIPWEIIPPLKIQDLTQFQIEGPNHERFGTTTFQISMNKGVGHGCRTT